MSGFDENDWQLLFAIAARVVPESTALDQAGRARFRAIVTEALAMRPAAMVRQLRLFLAVLRRVPLLRYGAPFDRLSQTRQDSVLRFFQDAPLQKLRQGMWGVKVLAFMGYYAQPEVAPLLHYTPSFDGNRHLDA